MWPPWLSDSASKASDFEAQRSLEIIILKRNFRENVGLLFKTCCFLRLCLLICAKFKSKFLLTFWVSKNTFKFDGVDKLGRSQKRPSARSFLVSFEEQNDLAYSCLVRIVKLWNRQNTFIPFSYVVGTIVIMYCLFVVIFCNELWWLTL